MARTSCLAITRMSSSSFDAGESTVVLHPPADSGSWEVAAKDLLIGAPAAEGECIEVSIEREVPGIIDPALNARSSVRGTRSLQKFKMTIKP